jgi:hypothetical protein
MARTSPGLVERVTFHNEDSGFCVLRVKARGQRTVCRPCGAAHLAPANSCGRARTAQFGADFPPLGTNQFVAQRNPHLRACRPHLRSTVIANLSAQVVRFLISESVSQDRAAYGLAPAVRPPRPVSRSCAGLRCSTLII